MPDDDGSGGRRPRPGQPLREEIPQSAQAWIGDMAIVFAERDGGVAELAVHGEWIAWQVIRVPLGRTVPAGPYDLTVSGFGSAHGRDVLHLLIACRPVT